jgi:hypothetical protein
LEEEGVILEVVDEEADLGGVMLAVAGRVGGVAHRAAGD